MKRNITLLLFLLIQNFIYSQIKVEINKINKDSITINFPDDMVIKNGKEYSFKFVTNIKLSDSIKESFTGEFLKDGLIINKKFETHYEQGFSVYSKRINRKKNSNQIAKTMFYVNGTNKWIVSIDNENISRYNSNDINSESTIDIEIQSDLYDLKNAKFEHPVILFWMTNQQSFKKIKFNGNKVHIDLKEEKEFLKGLNRDEKHNSIVILLPQVYINNKALFGEQQQLRIYIMRYLK